MPAPALVTFYNTAGLLSRVLLFTFCCKTQRIFSNIDTEYSIAHLRQSRNAQQHQQTAESGLQNTGRAAGWGKGGGQQLSQGAPDHDACHQHHGAVQKAQRKQAQEQKQRQQIPRGSASPSGMLGRPLSLQYKSPANSYILLKSIAASIYRSGWSTGTICSKLTNSIRLQFSIFFVSAFIIRTYYTISWPVLREKGHLMVTFFRQAEA